MVGRISLFARPSIRVRGLLPRRSHSPPRDYSKGRRGLRGAAGTRLPWRPIIKAWERRREQTDTGLSVRGVRGPPVVDGGVGVQGVAAVRRGAAHAALRSAGVDGRAAHHRGMAGQAGGGVRLFAEAVFAVGGARFPQPIPVLPRAVRGLRPPARAGGTAAELHLAHGGGHPLGAAAEAALRPDIAGRDRGELPRRARDRDARRPAGLPRQRPAWHGARGRQRADMGHVLVDQRAGRPRRGRQAAAELRLRAGVRHLSRHSRWPGRLRWTCAASGDRHTRASSRWG